MGPSKSVHGVQVLAFSRASNIKAHHYLEISNRDGEKTPLLMPSSKVISRGSLREELADHGYPNAGDDEVFEEVFEYARTATPEARITLSNATGFIGSSYLLANGEVIGPKDAYGPMLNPELKIHKPKIGDSGDLESWKDTISIFCPYSHVLTLAVCTSISGLFIVFTDIETGGIHVHGPSSIGKSTLATVSASIHGGSRFIESWSVTQAGLEEIAAGRNHSTLILDELKVLDMDPKKAAKKAQNAIYQLAQGQGKNRSKVFQNEGLNWRLSVLSCGEKSLSAHAEAGGNEQMAGERVRLIDVPADAKKGWGIFHSLPKGMDSSEQCIKALNAACEAHHGVAGRELIKKMTTNLARDPEFLRTKLIMFMDKFVSKNCKNPTNGLQVRICRGFALAYASGICAIKFGILPLTEDQVMKAISSCYRKAIAEIPVSLDDRIQIAKSAVMNLAAKRLKSDYPNREKDGCIRTETDGKEVIAISNTTMKALVSDKTIRTKLTDQLSNQGILLRSSDDKSTRQLSYKTADGTKGKARFYCILSEKLVA